MDIIADKNKEKKVLILRTVDKDMRGYGGFPWPESGPVSAPEKWDPEWGTPPDDNIVFGWDPNTECGGGLHGLENGEGDWNLLDWSLEAKALIVETDEDKVSRFLPKIKFSSGAVKKVTTLVQGLTEMLCDKSKIDQCVQDAIKAGENYNSQNVQSGDYSTNAQGSNSSKNVQCGPYSKNVQGGDCSQNVQSGNDSQNVQSGGYSKNTQCGPYSKNVQSGDYSKNTQSDISSRNAQGGYTSKNVQSGDYSQNVQSGDYSQNVQGGDSSKNVQGGDYSQNAQNGDHSKNAQSGSSSKNVQSGDYSRNVQSGDYSRNAQSGDYSQNAQSGPYSKNAQSGEFSSSEMNGKHGVSAQVGINSKVKGVKGTLVALVHYDLDGNPIDFITGKIGEGDLPKENTWYGLDANGKFVEVK